jgi:protein tyrosine phosphatase
MVARVEENYREKCAIYWPVDESGLTTSDGAYRVEQLRQLELPNDVIKRIMLLTCLKVSRPEIKPCVAKVLPDAGLVVRMDKHAP